MSVLTESDRRELVIGLAVARCVAATPAPRDPGLAATSRLEPDVSAYGPRSFLEDTLAAYEWASTWSEREPLARAELERVCAELSGFGIDAFAHVDDCDELRAAIADRVQLEHECAVLDLTEAAQAATRAAAAEAGGEHAVARRHAAQSAWLYGRADYHRALAAGLTAAPAPGAMIDGATIGNRPANA